MINIVEIDKANKDDCKRMISYFLSNNCTKAVENYTKRLYSLIELDQDYLNPHNIRDIEK